jgi:hypothetical protein
MKTHTVHKFEQYWDYYRLWLVFLRTDHELEEVNFVPCWNYPWVVRGVIATVATLPAILFWQHAVAYLCSCFFIALVFVLAIGYKRVRNQRVMWRHERDWRPRKEWEPFLNKADWQAHESIADTMSIPPTPPPAEEGPEEPEELDGMWHWSTLPSLVFSPLAPLWIPVLILWPVKWQGDYTLHLRTSESDAAISSTDSL